MFIQFIIAMMLGLVCPSTTTTNNNTNGTYTTQDEPSAPDTGGDLGHVPPK